MPEHVKLKCVQCGHGAFNRVGRGYECRGCLTTYEVPAGEGAKEPPPSQLDRGRRMVLDIVIPNEHTVRGLQRLLEEARDAGNGGDGSISVERWQQLWDLEHTARQLREKVLRWING